MKNNKKIVSTYEDTVVSNGSVNVSTLVPWTQEKADARIFFQIVNASISGSTRDLVRTVNTDVAVITDALFTKLYLPELWLFLA